MYVGPKKFVESDFVNRMRLKHSTTSEDGTVILNPKFKLACNAVGGVLGAAVVIGLTAVAKHTILNQNNDENPED